MSDLPGHLDARRFLKSLFEAAVARADPAHMLAGQLPPPPVGRCVVVGAGKAAASMAAAVEAAAKAAWPQVPLGGVVVVPDGHGLQTRHVRVLEASHPVPDARSEAAARAVLDAVRGLTSADLVLVLISGGGSSLLALPAEGVSLADKQLVNRRLLASGLDIRSMNMVRRRLSAIKGGKLALAAAPARVVTLAISDIPGDDPAMIASGPSIPSAPPPGIDWSALVERIGPDLPAGVTRILRGPAPDEPVSDPPDVRVIGTAAASLEAAAAIARAAGIAPVILGDAVEGEAREVGAWLAAKAREPVLVPTLYLSGGETTVTLAGGLEGSHGGRDGRRHGGRGGRNTELLLALAVGLWARRGVWALCADTDGQDGNSAAAGAIVAPDSLARARRLGLDPATHLECHDSASLFGALGDLIMTGPTLTNVNDFRAVLVLP